MESGIRNKLRKNGFMLTIDGIIAITLVTVILITATNYVARSQSDILPELQLVRTGNDILNVLDNSGNFRTIDMDKLIYDSDNLVPVTYEMKIEITIGEYINTTNSQDLPSNKFIGTGERVFVTDNLEFGIARFWIWSRT